MSTSQPALAAIDARIVALRRARFDAVQKIREIDLRLEELDNVKRLVTESCGEGPPAPAPTAESSVFADQMPPGPTQAIIGLLANHPEGLNRHQIYEAIRDHLTTESGNPRRLISTILGNLKRQGRLQQTVSGKYYRVPATIPGAAGVTGLADQFFGTEGEGKEKDPSRADTPDGSR
jgi:hypothetical protein